MKQTTHSTTPKQIKRTWHLIDLKGEILGRAATQMASLLQGKHKSYYAPHLDCGDYVVVINSDKVKVTGRKLKQKIYFRHSGYPGGDKLTPFDKQLEKDSTKIIHSAVSGMLPKNKLRAPRLKRLRVFKGSKHNYQDKFKKDEK